MDGSMEKEKRDTQYGRVLKNQCVAILIHMKECFKEEVINDKECKIIKWKNVFYILHRVWKTYFQEIEQ